MKQKSVKPKSLKYFWDTAKGLKADVERHRQKEKELEDKIAELEEILKDQPESVRKDPYNFEVQALNTYRQFLAKLLQSKAEAVSKVGKKS